MKAFLAFCVVVLLAWAWLSAYYGLKQFEYIPFLGNMQYFCSRSGVEYLYFDKAETVALHVDKSGKPIDCDSNGVSL